MFLLIFSFLLLVPLIACYSTPCSGQPLSLKITHEEYQWTDEMKQVAMTTPERGLTFKIFIYNNSTDPLTLDNLYILIRVTSDDTQTHFDFSKQLTFDYNNQLFLPSHESDVRFVKVANDFGNSLQIGSYTAKLSYYYRYIYYGSEGTPIEPYPFNFRVASEETLQQEIQQNKGGTTINIGPFNISLFDFSVSLGGSIISIAVVAYLLNRRKKGK
jgi:hypothetical protein